MIKHKYILGVEEQKQELFVLLYLFIYNLRSRYFTRRKELFLTSSDSYNSLMFFWFSHFTILSA